MMKHSIKALTAGAALVLAASGAWAQTSTGTSGSMANPPSTTIGVTPQDAREATQKAVPRSDTGTLVRTEPSAAERAGEMAKDAKDAVTPATRSGTAATGNANPSQPRNTTGTTGTVNNTTTPSAAMGIDGNVPGSTAKTGDATNTRNNPGTTATGRTNTSGSSMDMNAGSSTRANRNHSNMRTNSRPARADRN